MAKRKVDDFLDLVRRSGLVERDQLKRVALRLKKEAGTGPITDSDFVGRRLVEAGLLSRWQCEKLLEGRHKGFFLGKYKLLDHLGTGGMSSVYLAEHLLMQRRVAIKVLPKARVQDSSYLARFHREAQAAAALDHRNIVRAYDVDNDGDIHYLVMEYVEGRDLLVMVKEDGPLDYPVAVDYIRQAAQGLAHAHQAGLIHRDVKPANLLVEREGVVKILDLGLARFTGEDIASLTVANDENVLGTADYLAPEQALDSHGVDGRADIYSLGCSLYYILTGHPPFPEGTLPQRLMMHQREPPPSIREDRADAPEDLVGICLSMMAKKPRDRPQSASEVSELMAAWLDAHGHAFDSASHSGGSSGKLAAAAAAEGGRLASAGEPAKAQLRRPGSGSDTTAPHRGAKTDSGLRRAEPLSDAALPSVGHANAPPNGRATGSSRQTIEPSAESQPVLLPADEPHVEVQLPAAQRPHEEQASPLDFITQVESPAVARLRARHQMTANELDTYRTRRQDVPIWVWVVIGVGSLLALILLVAFLFNR